MALEVDLAAGDLPILLPQPGSVRCATRRDELNPGHDCWSARPFRTDVVFHVPTLVVHGTWDTSTPIENAREVAASLPRATRVEVVGGNHGALYNLFARWPPMRSSLAAFLAGREVSFPATVDDTAAIRFAPLRDEPPGDCRDAGAAARHGQDVDSPWAPAPADDARRWTGGES